MTAPMDDKDKNPLMILEEGVKAIEEVLVGAGLAYPAASALTNAQMKLNMAITDLQLAEQSATSDTQEPQWTPQVWQSKGLEILKAGGKQYQLVHDGTARYFAIGEEATPLSLPHAGYPLHHASVDGTSPLAGGVDVNTTSDPQEPYRLDTKPPIATMDVHSRIVMGDPEPVPLNGPFVPPTWNLNFDPRASPKNIPFSVALEYIKAGRRVRMPEWIHAWVQKHDEYGLSFHRGYDDVVTPMGFPDSAGMGPVNALLGNDWEVIPEP